MNQYKHKIHIGNLIYNALKEEGRSASWLAKKIHCERSNIYKIFEKASIDASLLLKISLALKTNFFVYYFDIYQNTMDKNQENHQSVANLDTKRS